jgi:predicted ATP-dependent protease
LAQFVPVGVDEGQIGGANEKIEGFFDVCKGHGLTGKQGVLIPAANVRNLMLREDVLAAIEHGQFHVYPIQTIDQGLELLSSVRAGTVDEPGTVNGAVNQRLHDLAANLKKFASGEKNEKTSSHEDADETS